MTDGLLAIRLGQVRLAISRSAVPAVWSCELFTSFTSSSGTEAQLKLPLIYEYKFRIIVINNRPGPSGSRFRFLETSSFGRQIVQSKYNAKTAFLFYPINGLSKTYLIVVQNYTDPNSGVVRPPGHNAYCFATGGVFKLATHFKCADKKTPFVSRRRFTRHS